ncbi:rhodanese-like domain-containing protein [Candidatus Woesearchaeota archaeon]|nr:rhodanese-like domain-containing protein [Candidatus Woesearchaeota archaeon]
MKWAMLAILVVLAGCASTIHPVVELDPAQAKTLIDQKENLGLFVLNVHTPYEGKLDGTDAFIEDWENVVAHEDILPKDKHQPILLYCRTGRMSSSAGKQLQALGYTKIYHLTGGMKAWDAQGLPIIEKSWR